MVNRSYSYSLAPNGNALYDNSPSKTEIERLELRRNLAVAFRAVREFDGSELSLRKLMVTTDSLKAVALSREPEKWRAREELRRSLHRHSRQKEVIPAPIATLFELAADRFGKRLNYTPLNLPLIPVPYEFVPIQERLHFQRGPALELAREKYVPRLSYMSLFLAQNGISPSDYAILAGVQKEGTSRIQPYRIMQIPKLNREIAVCDQAGQAIYIAKGAPGPLFWATFNKIQLNIHPDVTSITMTKGWRGRLYRALIKNNPIIADAKPPLPQGLRTRNPLPKDVILYKGLEHEAMRGHLPNEHCGPVSGLPTQTFNLWQNRISENTVDPSLGKLSGLGSFFRYFGLRNAKGDNKDAIKKAWNNIQNGRPHGLKPSNYILTEDIILTEAITKAAHTHWVLPGNRGGAMPNFPDETFDAVNSALKNKHRHLTRENCRGLSHLYQIYGLRVGKFDDQAVIKAAWARIQVGLPHGLSDDQINRKLVTKDIILTKAIEVSATQDFVLPDREYGPVPGMPGHSFKKWMHWIANGTHGLPPNEAKSLDDLYQRYGLKTGRLENKEVIKVAWVNIQAGRPHGLNDSHANLERFSLDFILCKILEEWHVKGSLPNQKSGEILGTPNQNWAMVDRVIARDERILSNGIGLGNLYQRIGLKTGRIENIEIIERAWQNLTEGKPHGLIDREKESLTFIGNPLQNFEHAVKTNENNTRQPPQIKSLDKNERAIEISEEKYLSSVYERRLRKLTEGLYTPTSPHKDPRHWVRLVP